MTAALAMPSDETARAFGLEIGKALPQILTMHATSAETSEACSTALRALVTRRKQIDDERTKVTKPLNAVLRTVNGWFKPVDDRFEEAERHLRKEIGRYALETEQARRTAMFDAARGAPPPADPIPQHADAAGTTTRLVKKWRVVNPDAVPRELCAPDLGKIGAALTLGHTVPGVEWYEEAQVIARKHT